MEVMETVFDKQRLMRSNRFFQLGGETLQKLLALCDDLSSNDALQQRASAMHECYFHSDESIETAVNRWENEDSFPMDVKAGASALIVMSGIAHMQAAYRNRGIPERYLTESLSDMAIWMDDCRERTGKAGLLETGWLLHSMRGLLFRLGRFQFMQKSLDLNICVVTRRSDQMPVAFFMKPEKLRPDGLIDGTNGISDQKHGWQSRFENTKSGFAGNPLHPRGYALRQEVCLPPPCWEMVLQPGDGVLDLHIPKDGRMELLKCRDSILSAMEFFSRYYPDKPYKAIILSSWLLDEQLQTILPSESNIVRFQREFYHFPTGGNHRQTYERVFGDSSIGITCAPEVTSLQKAVKSYVLRGNQMRSGAGFILPQDMARFGEAQYQTRIAGELEKLLL